MPWRILGRRIEPRLTPRGRVVGRCGAGHRSKSSRACAPNDPWTSDSVELVPLKTNSTGLSFYSRQPGSPIVYLVIIPVNKP
ncbi:hypothetical protein [Nitrosomonas sp. Nm34]|uniref:hypothetical protein n=1 Tax=Nitrosomonas sp. Nm34 TaxID=1881055 RepID=UPI001113D5DB|nr:hypothetical protein [Nitrosomonas sp. Nm34]